MAFWRLYESLEVLRGKSMTNRFRQMIKRCGPPEVRVLVSMALIVTGVWGFAELAEVSEANSVDLDHWVMSALRDPLPPFRPIGPVWLLHVAKDITALGSFAVIFFLGSIVLVYLGLKGHYRIMALMVAAIIGGSLASMGLKLLFARPRPDIEHLVHVNTYSFPSGHAMISAVVYLTMGTMLARSEKKKRFKLFFLGVAILSSVMVGISRVYLGVHYPTDVMGGWIAGSVWALFCLLIADMAQRRSG
jgi:undecaprenyl-diphosphatase